MKKNHITSRNEACIIKNKNLMNGFKDEIKQLKRELVILEMVWKEITESAAESIFK